MVPGRFLAFATIVALAASITGVNAGFSVLGANEALPVLVSMVVREVSDVSSTAETFVADFHVALRYQDANALSAVPTGQNIAKGITASSFGIQEMSLEFTNGLVGAYFYQLTDASRTLTLADEAVSDYATIPVNSSWGWVERQLRYRGTFHTPFDLRAFPFDKQLLNISFEDVNLNNNKIVYYAKASRDDDLLSMDKPTGFDVLDHYHQTVNTYYGVFDESYSTHTLFLRLKRQSGIAFGVRIIGPLMITTMLSFFLWCYKLMDDKRHIPGATLFLAVVTYMFVLRSALPDLPYTTRIDNFTLICMLNNLLCFSWHALSRWCAHRNNDLLKHEVIIFDGIMVVVYLVLFIIMATVTISVDMDFGGPVAVYLIVLFLEMCILIALGRGFGHTVAKMIAATAAPSSAEMKDDKKELKTVEEKAVPSPMTISAEPV